MISCRELARRMFPRIFVEAIIFAVLSSAILVAELALKLLAFYSTNVESDDQLTPSRSTATWRQRTISSSMSPWAGASSTILWLNDFPKMSQQHAAFERYMEHGGGWIGFHVAGYFLGGAVFCGNNWPLLPAKLMVDDPNSPPRAFLLHLYHRRTNGICGNRAHA